jgi:hypothetical protein
VTNRPHIAMRLRPFKFLLGHVLSCLSNLSRLRAHHRD